MHCYLEVTMEKIPFNKPFIVGKELEYISQAVQNGHLAGGGEFTRKCEAWMESRFSASHVLLTNSCTAALEIAAMLCGIEPGDEVILPSFTYVSTASAFALRGAKLRFCDIREDTLNLDDFLVESAINHRTRVIVPAHYAGVACYMDSFTYLADHYNLTIVEDGAQAVNSSYKGKFLGTIGKFGAYSFHETKNFISGEGGALLVNDETAFELAQQIRDKGTNRNQFFRKEAEFYTWVQLGSSYLPSEMVAAFLYAQLEKADLITEKRMTIYNRYIELLTPLQDKGHIRLPIVPDECTHNGHLFYILVESEEVRQKLMDHLDRRNIMSVFHYIPLHASPMGQKYGAAPDQEFPVTERISKTILRLPGFYEFTEAQQDRVVKALFEFYGM